VIGYRSFTAENRQELGKPGFQPLELGQEAGLFRLGHEG
jgi:hypothetical protein